MKRILITGANSYIGTSFERYIKDNYSDLYIVETVNLRGGWQEKSFSEYDSVLHVAGIAHRKETKENRQLYYDINRDLTVHVAEKAKKEHVKQFVFMSTMGVYGKDSGVITKETPLAPKTNYGGSKLEAEQLLERLETDDFGVSIIRPPMVYGPGCKGNFPTLVKLAKELPVFPKVNNRRSMIYIDNLCEYLHRTIYMNMKGIFTPQNKEYVSTDEIAAIAVKKAGRKPRLSRALGVAVNCIRPVSKMADKAFGSLIYEETGADYSYCVVDKDESISRSIDDPKLHAQ